ncbi:hypothetical protein [Mycobacterium malmoense]|uniref:hypothetical protein n=1 Tax=Mycobacterium malmoense TaxID=1780 RepID=UPI0011300442|nr:hypothetical protein [Mycobacterium malmoense]
MGVGVNGATGSSLSWSHTAGTNMSVVVFHAIYSTIIGGSSVAALYGSEPMNYLGTVSFYSNSGYQAQINVWGLLNAPAGTQTVSLSYGTSWYSKDSSANSVSYSNVRGFGSPVTNTGAGTGMSLSVSSMPRQRIAQAFASSFSPTLSAYNQTSRWLAQPSGGDQPMQIGDAPGGGTVSFTETLSSSQSWGGIAVPLLPV